MRNGQAGSTVMADFKKNMSTIQQDYDARPHRRASLTKWIAPSAVSI
jgi:hypothetical protein